MGAVVFEEGNVDLLGLSDMECVMWGVRLALTSGLIRLPRAPLIVGGTTWGLPLLRPLSTALFQ